MHNLPYWAYGIRAAAVMAVLFIAFRLLGKRAAAQLNLYDLAMIMAVSNAVQNAMTGGRGELPIGFYCSTAVILLAWALTRLFVRYPGLEERVVGHPTVLINQGVVLKNRLRREQVTEDELEAAIRAHGLTSPAQVMLAVFEVDGSISVVPKQAEHYTRKVKGRHGSKKRAARHESKD